MTNEYHVIQNFTMENLVKECLWKNFAAAIHMFTNAISLCPKEMWQNEKKFSYLSYHTIIFLDYYLTNPVKEFQPHLPYTIATTLELPADAIDDVLPNSNYSKEDFLVYLSIIQEKCKKLILGSSEQKLQEKWITDSEIPMHGLCPRIVENYNILEILFYNLRHLQHHVAQLNLLLRQQANISSKWVAESN